MRAAEFVEYLEGITRGGSGWNARCPAHEDKNPSLSVAEGTGAEGGVVVHCHAGCSAEDVCRAVGLELRHLMEGVVVEPTIDDLAAHKGLSSDFLRSIGVHDLPEHGGVGINYFDRQGALVATKRRTALVAGDGSRWRTGQKLAAYGLWWLDGFSQARWLILVEGESDCWTGWANGFPCIGVPGANCVRSTITADVLAPFERVFVVQETDQGGATFVVNVQKVIIDTRWTGTASVVHLPAKDLSELYLTGPADFIRALNAALASAVPMSTALTSTVAHGDRTAWPDPQPLWSGPAPLPPLNPNTLPPSLQPWLVDIATRIGVPLEFSAVPAIVALGTVVGRKVAVRPKRNDTFTVVPNLWGALVGESGAAKSPAVVAALQPLSQLDDALRAGQQGQAADREFDQMVAKERRDVLAKQIRDAIKNGQDPAPLRAQMAAVAQLLAAGPQLMVSDATAEKLAAILAANPNGVLLHRDELRGFLELLHREGREGERQFFLEGWSGDGRFTQERIGRGSTHVPAVCISLVGTIQPGPLRKYVAAALQGGADNDGLIQRFQLMVHPEPDPAQRSVDAAPNAAAHQIAFEVFRRLHLCDAVSFGAVIEAGQLPYLRFDLNAQAIVDEWMNSLETRVRSGEEFPILTAHLQKYRSLMPSLALLFHLADVAAGVHPPGQITLNAAEMAISWASHLEAHARKIYLSSMQVSDPVQLLAAKIRSGELESRFTVRFAARKGWRGLPSTDIVTRAVDQLVASGWLRRDPVGSGGQQQVLLHVNPKVFELQEG